MTSSRSGVRTGIKPTPKVTDAFLVWRFYSREIEADLLRYYRIDIRDWYRGDLDSRRLLLLLEELPPDSSFQTWAMRGGDWSEDQYVQARILNEVALSRADGKGYMPTLLKSPLQIADEESTDSYRRMRHEETLRQLSGKE